MALHEAIRKRVDELLGGVDQLVKLANSYDQITDSRDLARCTAWIVATQNIVHQICEGTANPYLKKANWLADTPSGYLAHQRVRELAGLLKSLLAEAEVGLISSVADRASAGTFDNFLDHGQEYFKLSKIESGVIVGVVFEDTTRRICQKYGIVEKGQKLDGLISALTAMGKLTAVKAKRARAAADVRTKASNAQWDDFELSDVEAAITLTRELISDHLDA